MPHPPYLWSEFPPSGSLVAAMQIQEKKEIFYFFESHYTLHVVYNTNLQNKFI